MALSLVTDLGADDDDGMCEHYSMLTDKVCPWKAKHEVVITEPTHIDGLAMGGTYEPRTWHFCGTHFNLFEKGRRGVVS